MLGDNTYTDAFDFDYQKPVFDMYRDLLRRTVLWPTLGNHDAADDPGLFGTSGEGYLKVFTLPRNGEAGGMASGSEFYYSFDHANIHFVCLDSYLSDRSTNGAMLNWLRYDLAGTDKDWIIAFWHHPPYSWGTHNSDFDNFQTDMRERVLPILEAYGVDLVLSGHSHNYERSFLIDGHYGYSWQLQPSMILDGSLGGLDEEGPYRKPAAGLGAHQGTVYAVCGCSGQGGLIDLPRHPVMAMNQGGFGSMVLEISGLQLKASFLRPSGTIEDSFAIDKSAPATVRPALQIMRSAQSTIVTWPTSNPVFDLEWAEPDSIAHWQVIARNIAIAGRRSEFLVETNSPNRLFRLRAAPLPE